MANHAWGFGSFAADAEVQLGLAGGENFQEDGFDRGSEEWSDVLRRLAQYFRDGAAQHVGHFCVGAEDAELGIHQDEAGWRSGKEGAQVVKLNPAFGRWGCAGNGR